MVVSEEQKHSRINQKKRKPEENPHSNMVAVCDLDEEQIFPKDSGKKLKKKKNPHSNMVAEESPHSNDEEQISPKDSGKKMKNEESSEAEESRALPSCIDKLREELSCPICFELFFKPTTTWCGHSFCGRCLRYALIKSKKKCPNCRRFISGKSGTYNANTAIWNTIQLLFPQEVEERREAVFEEMHATLLGSKHIIFEQEEE